LESYREALKNWAGGNKELMVETGLLEASEQVLP
jgi:hypothetical protein